MKALYRGCFALLFAVMVASHPACAYTQQAEQSRRLAESAVARGDFAQAEQFFKDEVNQSVAKADRANALQDYALFCAFRNRNKEAIQMLTEALNLRRSALWPEHPDIAFALLDLARLQADDDDSTAAARNLIEVFDNHPNIVSRGADSIFNLAIQVAGLASSEGDYATAESVFKSALRASDNAQTRQRPTMMIRLANVLSLQGKNKESASAYNEALQYILLNRPWNDRRRQTAVARIKARLAALPSRDGVVATDADAVKSLP